MSSELPNFLQSGDIVWAQSDAHFPFWPAIVLDVDLLPEEIRCSFAPPTATASLSVSLPVSLPASATTSPSGKDKERETHAETERERERERLLPSSRTLRRKVPVFFLERKDFDLVPPQSIREFAPHAEELTQQSGVSPSLRALFVRACAAAREQSVSSSQEQRLRFFRAQLVSEPPSPMPALSVPVGVSVSGSLPVREPVRESVPFSLPAQTERETESENEREIIAGLSQMTISHEQEEQQEEEDNHQDAAVTCEDTHNAPTQPTHTLTQESETNESESNESEYVTVRTTVLEDAVLLTDSPQSEKHVCESAERDESLPTPTHTRTLTHTQEHKQETHEELEALEDVVLDDSTHFLSTPHTVSVEDTAAAAAAAAAADDITVAAAVELFSAPAVQPVEDAASVVFDTPVAVEDTTAADLFASPPLHTHTVNEPFVEDTASAELFATPPRDIVEQPDAVELYSVPLEESAQDNAVEISQNTSAAEFFGAPPIHENCPQDAASMEFFGAPTTESVSAKDTTTVDDLFGAPPAHTELFEASPTHDIAAVELFGAPPTHAQPVSVFVEDSTAELFGAPPTEPAPLGDLFGAPPAQPEFVEDTTVEWFGAPPSHSQSVSVEDMGSEDFFGAPPTASELFAAPPTLTHAQPVSVSVSVEDAADVGLFGPPPAESVSVCMSIQDTTAVDVFAAPPTPTHTQSVSVEDASTVELFGAPPTASELFGTPPTHTLAVSSQDKPAVAAVDLFAAPPTESVSGKATSTVTAAADLFGAPPTHTQQTVDLFGPPPSKSVPVQVTAAAAVDLFGAPPTHTESVSGKAAPAAAADLFGAPPTQSFPAQDTAAGLFGAPPTHTHSQDLFSASQDASDASQLFDVDLRSSSSKSVSVSVSSARSPPKVSIRSVPSHSETETHTGTQQRELFPAASASPSASFFAPSVSVRPHTTHIPHTAHTAHTQRAAADLFSSSSHSHSLTGPTTATDMFAPSLSPSHTHAQRERHAPPHAAGSHIPVSVHTHAHTDSSIAAVGPAVRAEPRPATATDLFGADPLPTLARSVSQPHTHTDAHTAATPHNALSQPPLSRGTSSGVFKGRAAIVAHASPFDTPTHTQTHAASPFDSVPFTHTQTHTVPLTALNAFLQPPTTTSASSAEEVFSTVVPQRAPPSTSSLLSSVQKARPHTHTQAHTLSAADVFSRVPPPSTHAQVHGLLDLSSPPPAPGVRLPPKPVLTHTQTHTHTQSASGESSPHTPTGTHTHTSTAATAVKREPLSPAKSSVAPAKPALLAVNKSKVPAHLTHALTGIAPQTHTHFQMPTQSSLSHTQSQPLLPTQAKTPSHAHTLVVPPVSVPAHTAAVPPHKRVSASPLVSPHTLTALVSTEPVSVSVSESVSESVGVSDTHTQSVPMPVSVSTPVNGVQGGVFTGVQGGANTGVQGGVFTGMQGGVRRALYVRPPAAVAAFGFNGQFVCMIPQSERCPPVYHSAAQLPPARVLQLNVRPSVIRCFRAFDLVGYFEEAHQKERVLPPEMRLWKSALADFPDLTPNGLTSDTEVRLERFLAQQEQEEEASRVSCKHSGERDSVRLLWSLLALSVRVCARSSCEGALCDAESERELVRLLLDAHTAPSQTTQQSDTHSDTHTHSETHTHTESAVISRAQAMHAQHHTALSLSHTHTQSVVPHNALTQDSAAIEALLVTGERVAAADKALEKGDYALALLLSTACSPEKYREVVRNYALTVLPRDSALQLLALVYSVQAQELLEHSGRGRARECGESSTTSSTTSASAGVSTPVVSHVRFMSPTALHTPAANTAVVTPADLSSKLPTNFPTNSSSKETDKDKERETDNDTHTHTHTHTEKGLYANWRLNCAALLSNKTEHWEELLLRMARRLAKDFEDPSAAACVSLVVILCSSSPSHVMSQIGESEGISAFLGLDVSFAKRGGTRVCADCESVLSLRRAEALERALSLALSPSSCKPSSQSSTSSLSLSLSLLGGWFSSSSHNTNNNTNNSVSKPPAKECKEVRQGGAGRESKEVLKEVLRAQRSERLARLRVALCPQKVRLALVLTENGFVREAQYYTQSALQLIQEINDDLALIPSAQSAPSQHAVPRRFPFFSRSPLSAKFVAAVSELADRLGLSTHVSADFMIAPPTGTQVPSQAHTKTQPQAKSGWGLSSVISTAALKDFIDGPQPVPQAHTQAHTQPPHITQPAHTAPLPPSQSTHAYAQAAPPATFAPYAPHTHTAPPHNAHMPLTGTAPHTESAPFPANTTPSHNAPTQAQTAPHTRSQTTGPPAPHRGMRKSAHYAHAVPSLTHTHTETHTEPAAPLTHTQTHTQTQSSAETFTAPPYDAFAPSTPTQHSLITAPPVTMSVTMSVSVPPTSHNAPTQAQAPPTISQFTPHITPTQQPTQPPMSTHAHTQPQAMTTSQSAPTQPHNNTTGREAENMSQTTPSPASPKPPVTPSGSNTGSAKEENNGNNGPSSGLVQKVRKGLMSWLYPEATDATEHIGGSLEAYYDDKLKRWVFPGEEDAAQNNAALKPPPTGPMPSQPAASGPPSLSGPPHNNAPPSLAGGGPNPSNNGNNTDNAAYDPLAAMMAPPPLRAMRTSMPASVSVSGAGAPPSGLTGGPPVSAAPPTGPPVSAKFNVWRPPATQTQPQTQPQAQTESVSASPFFIPPQEPVTVTATDSSSSENSAAGNTGGGGGENSAGAPPLSTDMPMPMPPTQVEDF